MPFQNSQVNMASTLNWQGDFGQLGTPNIPLLFGGQIQFANGAGSGDGQANNLTGGTLSITSGTPVVLDLNSLLNPDGSACSFADLLLVAFWNYSTTAGQDLVVGGGTDPVVSIWGSGNLTVLANLDGTASAMFCTTAATGWAIDSSTAHTFRLEVAAGTGVQIAYAFVGH
jgi:hypothetical protein